MLVHPLGVCKKHFKEDSQKGIFLRYMPHTDRVMIFYDENSQVVKLVTHGVFDEGFNDLPIEAIPPNCQHIQWINDNVRKEIDDNEIHSSDL